MESSLDNLAEALRQVKLSLSGIPEPWLVGGSCGLMLQGVPLHAAPRDLDLYADSKGAIEIHKVLLPYSLDNQIEDQSGIYKSILSHYDICGIKVELVGGFEVRALGCTYKVEAAFLAEAHSLEARSALEIIREEDALVLKDIKLMPLEHELLFNLLRSRPDRYEAIAAVMRSRMTEMSETMCELIRRNTWSDRVIEQLMQLLQTKKRHY